jgi:N-acetylglucosamine-6-phosphate deacetylase
MQKTVITNAVAILENEILENANIEVTGDQITAITTDSSVLDDAAILIDAGGNYIGPGFVDVHVHGGAGADFMDGSVDAVIKASQAHLRHGTTTIFPTTTTGSVDEIQAMIDACLQVSKNQNQILLPRIPGIHLYGPFFAPDKVGCHSADGRREPTAEEYEMYFNTGFVRIATCAAELPGSQEFYRAAKSHGCLLTCGHSNASWSEMQSAFDSGMRHVDHFWCAMSSVSSLRSRFGTPMQAGMEQFVLMNQQMSTEVIADGEHLSNELLEFAFRMIGPDRLCLVTDSSRALDMPPGHSVFGNIQTGSPFQSNGKVGLTPAGDALASSVQGMDHMLRTMKNATTASLPELFRMASLTPAKITGLSSEVGSIEVGKKADLLMFDQDLKLKTVILGGVVINSIE